MPPPIPTTFKIDFVSDIVCPWCAIALHCIQNCKASLAAQMNQRCPILSAAATQNKPTLPK